MTLLTLTIVAGLVVWALRLMDKALVNQEFSLMLAGFLVASSAAAVVGVYFLMSDYMVYSHQSEFLLSSQYPSDFVVLDEENVSAQWLDPELESLEIANLLGR